MLPLVLLAVAAPPDPQALADRIDRHLAAGWADARPAPPADDAEFFRRAHLDLVGVIPRPHAVRAFLLDPDPGKRAKLVDDLLDSPPAAAHAARVWQAALLPETAATADARVFQPGFEAWLRDRFRANTPYDRLVRDLLAVPLAAAPRPALRKPDEPNPLAFVAVKDAKPENLAAAATRVFLGVQMECAQCHDHPFAPWTRDQFWQQAAFFAGVERHGDRAFAPLSEATARRTVTVQGGKRSVGPAFLDESEPPADADLRAVYADWVTAKTNPFFARAAVNRVWGQLFGVGLVDPVDDFHDSNPPSHPALLADLAGAFAAADFDLRYLTRAVTRTRAYGRTSRQTHPSQADPRVYARGPVKGLSGEQFFDSLARAVGHRDGPDRAGSPRERVVTAFALQGKRSAPATSVPQALALMNGPFVAAAARPDGPTLQAVCGTPGLTDAERVEALFLLALSRPPTAAEQTRAADYVSLAGSGRRDERLADLFWALLNTAEFRLNH